MVEEHRGPKIVVGLGNPGPKYDGTRHNVGFEVLNELHQQTGSSQPTAKFEGQLATTTIAGSKVVLVWPMTYMNLSGRCVSAVARFYKIDVEQDLMIVCDDLSLPLGKMRIRPKGSAGGQKGLNHILQSLGSQAVARLRIGIDPTPPQWETSDYVLGRFQGVDKEIIRETVLRAGAAVADWCQHGLSHCMNQFNQ